MNTSVNSLSNQIIVVTGSEGLLGKTLVKYLLNNKAKVIGLDKKYSNYKKDNFIFIKTDITSKKSLLNSHKTILKKIGSPTGLVHCAAYNPKLKLNENNSVENFPIKTLEKSIEINIKGSFLVCQIFGSNMALNKKGSIILINSIYGILSPKHFIYKRKESEYFKPIDYSITKSSLINMSRYLATYWANKNLRVNTISAGGIYNNQDKSFVKQYSQNVPLGKMADKNDLNGAVYYLISNQSSYVTGANIIIDGGWSAW